MTLSLSQFQARIEALIQSDAGLVGSSDLEHGVRRALEIYSDDAPRELVADQAGDGSAFEFDLPASFLSGWSRFVSVEFPAGERVPVYLEATDWTIYRTASTTKLRLLTVTPSSSQTVRLTYTAAHTIEDLDSATATTIPSYHVEAFVKLGASEALLSYAARYLHEQENTLGADSVERGGKSDTARRLANAYAADYREMLGIRRGAPPALAVVDLDTSIAASGIDRLTHPRRRY